MKKMLFMATLVAGVAMLPHGAEPAKAQENRTLKCKIGRARSAAPVGGPALVANVPRSMTPIALDAVLMTDRGVWKNVIVEGLYARRTEMETVEISARLVNCSKKPLSIQVRSSFLDATQAPAEKASVWKPVFLSPLSTGVYQERSIGTTNVANYLIEVRSPQ
ncbi:MAG: hypothetical protein ABW039_12265 [Sphingobium sp.]